MIGVAVEDASAPPRGESDPRAVACWTMGYGFARLALDGAFGPGPGAARHAAEVMLPAVLECSRV